MKLSRTAVRSCAVLVATVAMGIALAGPAVAKRVNVSHDLLTPGTLLVGSDIPYPPFEFGRKGHYDGFDIDLVNAMVRKMKLRVKYEDTPFDTIFTDVSRGKFDLVASAATITPERRHVVRFSEPYYDAQLSLVVPSGSPIHSIRDLKGAIVGAQDGTYGEAFVEDETDARKVITFPNGPAAIRAVKRGRVDATIIDQPVIQDALDKGLTGLEIARNIPTGERYGFALSKKTPKLLKGVNQALRRIKANGTFKRIYRKWFGIKPPPSLG